MHTHSHLTICIISRDLTQFPCHTKTMPEIGFVNRKISIEYLPNDEICIIFWHHVPNDFCFFCFSCNYHLISMWHQYGLFNVLDFGSSYIRYFVLEITKIRAITWLKNASTRWFKKISNTECKLNIRFDENRIEEFLSAQRLACLNIIYTELTK